MPGVVRGHAACQRDKRICLGRQGKLRLHALSAASYLQTTSNCPYADSACICSTVMPRPSIARAMASMTATPCAHQLGSMHSNYLQHSNVDVDMQCKC